MKRMLHNVQQNMTLRTRLLLLFILLTVPAIATVGITSYVQAKNISVETIEHRLVSETRLMGYIAENLKFLYVSDEDYFFQQLNTNIRTQQDELLDEGIEAEYLYIQNGNINIFPVSAGNIPEMTIEQINDITNRKNDQITNELDGEEYTITFHEMDAIDGIYVMLVP